MITVLRKANQKYKNINNTKITGKWEGGEGMGQITNSQVQQLVEQPGPA